MSEKFLKVIRADSKEEFRRSVELQKWVYCDECKYEDRKDHRNPDAFDEIDMAGQSKRVLVLNEEDIAVATARLIVPGELAFPALSLQSKLSEKINGNGVVEVSSFCYSKKMVNKLELSKD
ncbi:MAG: hypothetical protein ACQESA_02920, partial [Patescibacteria group bacterium]